MQVGLFEALSGRFADGTPLDAVGEDQHRLLSVIDNLNRLFNHRQDALTHLPDYGLPDLSHTYRDNAEMILDFRFRIFEWKEVGLSLSINEGTRRDGPTCPSGLFSPSSIFYHQSSKKDGGGSPGRLFFAIL